MMFVFHEKLQLGKGFRVFPTRSFGVGRLLLSQVGTGCQIRVQSWQGNPKLLQRLWSLFLHELFEASWAIAGFCFAVWFCLAGTMGNGNNKRKFGAPAIAGGSAADKHAGTARACTMGLKLL